MHLNHLVLLISLLSCTTLNVTQTNRAPASASNLPLTVKQSGILNQLELVGRSIPEVTFRLDTNQLTITVGASEVYQKPYLYPSVVAAVQSWPASYLEETATYHNTGFTGLGQAIYLVERVDTTYRKTITNFRRSDIPITYLTADSAQAEAFASLHRYLTMELLSVLQDTVVMADKKIYRSLTEALAEPEQVYRLSLRNNRIRSLPKEISRLTNLRELDISGSLLTSLPEEIGELRELRVITGNASRLTSLPAALGRLPKLRMINVGYCRLDALPSELAGSTSLWELLAGDNRLTELPDSYRHLDNLFRLHIDANRLTEFPQAITGMASLYSLWLHDNKITELPNELVDLPQLGRMYLEGAEVTNLAAFQSRRPDVWVVDDVR